ncbi:MAG TPA: heavy metal-binding domain-containing protein [Longimicrobium sp.]|jgi:uncharacterized protein YbjQ (UPF0145 family)
MHPHTACLISTTSTLQGYEIAEYLGPVSVHVVAGTNLVSDFFAGVSDIFGGRSSSYQSQLSALYRDATEQLRREAEGIGADAVVGLAIDFDELSAQGKSMFMLNAVGTAVRLSARVAEAGVANSLSGQELHVLTWAEHQASAARRGSLRVTSKLVQELIRWRVHDSAVAAAVLAHGTAGAVDYPISADELTAYFRAIPRAAATSALFDALANAVERPAIARTALATATSLGLLDLAHALELLRSEHPEVRILAARTLTNRQANYTPNDIPRLEAIRERLDLGFPSRYRRSTEKAGLFGSGEKTVWVCSCGKGRKMDSANTTCSGCELDQYGFPHNVFGRDDALAQVSADLAVLRVAFGDTPGSTEVMS